MGLVVSLFLLVDLTLSLLMLLQFYSVGIEAVLIIVLVLPLAALLPTAAGLNALFSSEARKSTGLARVYALWNVTSIVNVVSLSEYFRMKPSFSQISTSVAEAQLG